MQIVLAWAEKTKLVPTGRYVTRDLNLFPEFKAEWEGQAGMWLRRARDADLAEANEYAAKEGRLIFTFPDNEKDPLGKARQMAVDAAKRTEA